MIQSRDSPGNLNQSLDSLLDESDGVEFFYKFLSYQHSASHLLDFWFACKGFRSNVDLSNPEKLFQVAKVIYRTYIKSGAPHAVPLPYLLKQNINDSLSSYHDGYKKSFNSDGSILPPDRCMFDPAQNVIKDLLEQKYYPEFLTFISCPGNLQNLSSGEQVCREREVRNKYLEILYPEQTSDSFGDVISKQKSIPLGSKLPTDQLTNDTSQHSCNNKVDVPCEHHDNYNNKPQITHQSRLLNMLPSQDTNHTAQQSSTSMQTACHPNHVNISTGGLLVHGNHFNSVSKEPSHPNKLHHPVRKQTNLAESDPPLFVQLLTERLEKVKESRDKVEKLMSLVNQVDEKHSVESGHSSVPLKDTKDYNRSLQLNNSTWCQQDATNSSINPSVNEVNFTSAHIIHSSTDDSKRLNHPHESVFHKNRRHTDKSQDAQEILDDHCSRIWADELGDSTINASKTYYRRQQSDCSRNTTSRSSTTPYPIISDTLVHSMHSSLVRGGSSGTEYEMKRLSEQYRTTTASYSSANSNNNINSNQPTMSDSSHRRWHTAGSYRGMNRVNKSDVRSTASWDSGVVTSYEMKSLNLNNNADDNDYLDAETSSILEAASVQALSSSTTELALVNGEVTAKLVEKMIRHYPHKTFNRDSRHNGNMLPLFNSNQGKKETINPGYEYKYRLERKWQQQQQSGHFYESPYVQGFNPNSSICSACQHSADRVPCDWNHHCFHYPSTHSASNEHSSPPHLMVTSCGCNQSSDKSVLGSSCRSFPTASDTSSTFDSGISSAYDQLPLQKHTNNRENRSQSLHNWQMNVNLKDTNLSTPRGNRTHSASKSSCDSNNTSRSINYPQTNCFISSCYEFNLKQLPGHYMQNDLCPTRHHHCPEIMTIKDVNKHDGNECKKPSSGKLLQHWLQLQQQHPSEKSHCPANDEQGKALSDNTIPGDHLRSHISKVCKESHERKTHHHGHNHRKSSAPRTNSSPKYSLNTGNTSNMESSICQYHSDDDDNKTNSRLTNTQQQQQTSNVNSSGPGLVVGYYLCDDPVPYRTVWTGPTTVSHNNQSSSASSAVLVEVNDQSQTVDNCQTNSTGQPLLTLGQFKQLIAKKGVYRYFFKKPNDEFGTGVVHEELTNDDATLPLWEGKVVARVERAD